MSILLTRAAALETVQVETRGALDGQGKPSYLTAVPVQARVAPSEEVIRTAAGDETRVMAVLWIDAAQAVLPKTDDRVTTVAGLVGIVVDRSEQRDLRRNQLDHVRIKLRQE